MKPYEGTSLTIKSATSSRISSHLAARMKDWSRVWEGKIGYCELCCWQQKVFGLTKEVLGVKFIRRDGNWCWSLTRTKTSSLKIVWKAGAPCLLFNRWFTSRILNKSTVWVEKSFHRRFMCRMRQFFRVIWRWFAPVKCGNITSGFWKFCDGHEINIVWFTESVDKQNSGMWLSSCYQVTVPSIKKNASQAFSLGDFVLESLFCAQILWLLNLFSADTCLWDLMVWLTKRL